MTSSSLFSLYNSRCLFGVRAPMLLVLWLLDSQLSLLQALKPFLFVVCTAPATRLAKSIWSRFEWNQHWQINNLHLKISAR